MYVGLTDDEGVEVPDELISTHAEGRLMLFVGAGVSVDPPSELPTLQTLTEKLCTESQESLPTDGITLDKKLGLLKEKGVNIHQRVKNIIDSPESKPNDLHNAIAELTTTKQPRIVTTNYDRHLSTCLEERLDGDLNEYPSLTFPQREDFTGIVYLHGSVKEPAEHLVVTDADFGKVYLETPWTAAQFLSGVFRNFTVLFIGYSHDDTLMEYLARSLPADKTNRFALCNHHENENKLWQQRGIKPIKYGTHDALPELLRKWADQVRMGILEHRQRIETIACGVPPLSREDESYLQEAVTVPEHLRFFTKSARAKEWLRWAQELPNFKRIFEPRAECQPNDLWVQWFVEHFALCDNSKLRKEAFSIFLHHGSNFSPGLWYRLRISCQKSLKDRNDAAKDAKKWLLLLIQQIPQGGKQHLGWLLDNCDPKRDQHTMLLLLDKLLEPQPVLSRHAHFRQEARLEPSFEGDPWEIWTYWSSSLCPNLSDEALASSVAAILDRHLRAAHLIAAPNGDPNQEWFELSFARSAIETHEQDEASRHKDIGLLLDMARDTLEALLEHHPELAKHYLSSWDNTQMPLLQRLAIHGWTERQDVTADKKITKLCNSGWIFSSGLIHETMRLAVITLPDTSPEAINSLVAHIEAGLHEEDEYSERRVYEWLAWVAQHSSSAPAVQQALSAIQERNPQWQPSEHPDLLSWSWSDTVEPPNLGSPEDLHQIITDNPAKAIEHLLSFFRNGEWDEPRWWDALGWLQSTLESYPADGIKIIDVLLNMEKLKNPHASEDFANTVFRVWTKSEFDPSLCQAIAERLPAIWVTGTANWTRSSDLTNNNVGPLTQAINHWAGHLAEVVLGLVHKEYQAAEASWNGLTKPTKTMMEAITSENNQASLHAQVVLASRLSFLFVIDEQWCREQVLPLLDPNTNRDRAIRCWDGLLFGRLGPPKLLETGLLNLFVAMSEYLGDQHNETGMHFHRRLAEIAISSGINPIEQGWLNSYTAKASRASRVKWIRQVSYMLPQLSSKETDAQWDAWMLQYWSNRLDSEPRSLTDDEATTLVGWTATLGSRFPEAVELACKHTASMAEHSTAITRLHRLDDQPERINHLEKHPEHTARLLAHLLSHTETTLPLRQTLEGHALNEMIPTLLSRITPEQARPLKEQAVRMGIDI
ncbi:MAG: DUF4020 domain-containing protein [Acidimicrobiia bacterium]|nr:DUF4020 domain-containing protein [Acidimicrobiia bacterium]